MIFTKMRDTPIIIDATAAHLINEPGYNWHTVSSAIGELEDIVNREDSFEFYDIGLGRNREGINANGLAAKHRALNYYAGSEEMKKVKAFFGHVIGATREDDYNILGGAMMASLTNGADVVIDLSHMGDRDIEEAARYFISFKSRFRKDLEFWGFRIHVDEDESSRRITLRSRLSNFDRGTDLSLMECEAYARERQLDTGDPIQRFGYNTKVGRFYPEIKRQMTVTPHSMQEIREEFDFELSLARLNESCPWLGSAMQKVDDARAALSYFKRFPEGVLKAEEVKQKYFSEYKILFLQHTIADCVGMLRIRNQLSPEKLREAVLELHKSRHYLANFNTLFDRKSRAIEKILDSTYFPQLRANWNNLDPLIAYYRKTVNTYIEMISAAQSLKENRVAIVTAGSDMGFFIQNFYYMLRLVQKKHIHYVPPVSQTEKIR